MKIYWKCEYYIYTPNQVARYEIWSQNGEEWKCLYLNENGIAVDSVIKWAGTSKVKPYTSAIMSDDNKWTQYDTWEDMVLDAI